MSWLIATGNAHKLREIGQVLTKFGIDILSPREACVELDPKETGSTFAENATIKALAYARETGRVCLADDSGLAVDHLYGGPGVYSARYAGPSATDDDNNQKLLASLSSVPPERRTGRYRCVVAVAWPDPTSEQLDGVPEGDIEGIGSHSARIIRGTLVCTFHGALEGRVVDEAKGDGGFGYDPYFVLPDGRHLAELTDAEKNAISHRGNALRQLAAFLNEHPSLLR